MRCSIAGTFASLTLIAAAAACGSTDGDGDLGSDAGDTDSATGSGGKGADSGADLGSDLSSDSSTGSSGSDLSIDGSGTGGTSLGGAGPVCEAAESAAEPTPVFLGFAFDVSGSMGKLDRPNWWHDPVAKWTPVVTATAAFFESPSSAGLQASLAFFPAASDSCDEDTYEDPTVAMTELPSTAFAAQFSAYEEEVGTPLAGGDWRGGTPTHAATLGVSQYLIALREETPDGKFAIVLVTDGLPQSCSEGLAEVVTLVEDLAADGIATYVIGIENPTIPPVDEPDGWADWGDCPSGGGGDDTPCTPPDTLQALNDIAEAGGTGAAFLIDTGNPEATQTAFTAAISEIRSSTVSCALAIPPHPEPGKTFEGDKIDVAITMNGTTVTLPYDEACSEPTGWHFDEPDEPVQIELCKSTCTELQSAPDAAVKVEFLCEPRVDVVK